MADFKETAFDYVDVDDKATFCSSERRWINKMIKLSEKFPDEVKIDCMPEDNGGVILVHLPKNWLKISPPAKMNLSDEQRKERAERIAVARKKKGE